MENYGLKIQIKWIVVNSLPLMSNKDPSLKVPSQTFKLSLYFLFFSPSTKICFKILQTFLNHATIFVKIPDESSLGSGRFVFSPTSNDFVNNFTDVRNEVVLYNWTDRASMFISKADRPFRATKEMHLAIVQALINVCSKIGSSIVY